MIDCPITIEWKKEADGSYTSVAGRVWRYPGESWATCCIIPASGHRGGRVGNLRESKLNLERDWLYHKRRTDGPVPDYLLLLADFGQSIQFGTIIYQNEKAVIKALCETYNGHSVIDPKRLVDALTTWWRQA